jgi:hypothetical protein
MSGIIGTAVIFDHRGRSKTLSCTMPTGTNGFINGFISWDAREDGSCHIEDLRSVLDKAGASIQ